MHRELIPTYALVGGCALIGLLVAVFVIEYEPRVLMGAYGAGVGLMVGAFIAAIASNEPLVGGGSRHKPLFPQSPPPPAAGLGGSLNGHTSSNGHVGTNGHGGLYEGEDNEEEARNESLRRQGRLS